MISNQSRPGPPALLTVTEACEALRISRWMFYRLVQQRQLHTVKIGTRRLVAPAAIQEFINSLATGAPA